MIVRPRPGVMNLLFTLRGSVVPTIAPRVLFVFVLSAVIGWLHHVMPQHFRPVNAVPFTLLGLALSIFLGFRNNACYDRWWEGRRQWGQLLSETRILAREIITILPDQPGLHQRLVRRLVAFAHALRAQLRATGDDIAREWLPPEDWPAITLCRSRPDAILLAQAHDLRPLLGTGALPDMLYRILSDRMESMTNIHSACERLRGTPMPYTYSLLLHRTAWLFCLFLPLGLVGTLGLATPIATTILAFAFFGLDALGEELEEPFRLTQNALPLDAIVRLIEIAALEALGEPNLPHPLEPDRYVLH